MNSIHSMTLDNKNKNTWLCHLGASIGTDKSPLNAQGHRHPYTSLYSLLLSQYRFQPVRFAEIGIAMGASAAMWSHFFNNGKIFMFDSDENFIKNCQNYNLRNVTCNKMDVFQEDSIRSALTAIGGNLDVLLDDSTHGIDDQIRIIKTALPFIRPGGMILIEDVFRTTSEDDYEKRLEDVLDHFSFCSFITTEHDNKFSGTWNNDKILVLIKK
jgi:predicted O-methyltransferase YrrM